MIRMATRQLVRSILTRTIKPIRIWPGFSVCYVPRGPLLDWNDQDMRKRTLSVLETYCRAEKGYLYQDRSGSWTLEPAYPGEPGEQPDAMGIEFTIELTSRKWRFSSEQIQFRNTVLIDLRGTEDAWLARMKQKTRYNIRLAQRSGVTVREASIDDLHLLYHMYAQDCSEG